MTTPMRTRLKSMTSPSTKPWLFLVFLSAASGLLAAQAGQQQPKTDSAAPDLAEMIAHPQNEMRIVVQRFDADHGNLSRFYNIPISPTRFARLQIFCRDWAIALKKLDATKLSPEAQASLQSLQKKIEAELRQLGADAKAQTEIAPLLPFAHPVIALQEARQRMEPVDSAKAAGVLNEVQKQIKLLSQALRAEPKADGFKVTKALSVRAADSVGSLRTALKAWFGFYNGYDPLFTWWMGDPYKSVDRALQDYAALLREKGPGATVPVDLGQPSTVLVLIGETVDVPNLHELMAVKSSELREVVQRFQADRPGGGKKGGAPLPLKGAGDPERLAKSKKFYTDWLSALGKLDFDKLSQDGKVDYLLVKNSIDRDLRRMDLQANPPKEKPARPKDASGIAGNPIGREALLAELAAEMIGYTPEELLAIADKEFAWCDAEMKKATRDMGLGEDWRAAVEKVKTMHAEPGKQPAVIRDLAWEAIRYLDRHDLVTVPDIARDTWRMEMMTPQRQLVNPFFTGGETISVSFPTNTMAYEDRLQSMRGNNTHFSRATVHHELIPGHHLQGFMSARFNTHRRQFGTPFWTEGWALYWELLLYERGFPKTAEDRVGFLFWRMHRCARIHFSLNYHLGKWTPQECIDYLVKRVGHEPANATAEVRRSLVGNYGPLYQAGYLLGGMQIFQLHREMVESGKMTNRQFHDAVLQANNMPIEMVRALVSNQRLSRDFTPHWKFAD
jgi:uncharacterized protein (DUF885 family)